MDALTAVTTLAGFVAECIPGGKIGVGELCHYGMTMGWNLVCRPGALVRELPAAAGNRLAGRGSLDLRLPWMPRGTIDFLHRKARPHWRVLEFGSGGSTLFFADRVAEVISVEHDGHWASNVADRLAREGIAHATVRHVPPADGHHEGYASRVRVHRDQSFRDYATVAEQFPDGYFDLVVIDGRVREACTRHALAKVRRGGYLLLDNSERLRYRPIHALMNGRPSRTFFGFTPYHVDPSQSTVWLMGR